MKIAHRVGLHAALALFGLGVTSAASAACTVDECYRSAVVASLNHLTVENRALASVCPRAGVCLVDRGVGGVERIDPNGALRAAGDLLDAQLLRNVTVPIRNTADDYRARGFTLILRVRQASDAVALENAGGLIALHPGDPLTSQSAFELFVDGDGRLSITRVNGFTEGQGAPVRYSFDLWEPRALRSADDYITFALRFSGDGKLRLDAFTAEVGADGVRHVRWDQGKQEVDYPFVANAYPMGGQREAQNHYLPLRHLAVGPGGQPASYGALNRVSVFGKALSDDEVLAVVNREFSPAQSLEMGTAPCNTGRYLNFDGAPVRTPCGELQPLLERENLTANLYVIHAPERRPLVRRDQTVVLGDPVPEDQNPLVGAHWWRVNSANFNQVFVGVPASGPGQADGGALEARADGSVVLAGQHPVGPTSGREHQAWTAEAADRLVSLSQARSLCADPPTPLAPNPVVRLCHAQETPLSLTFVPRPAP